MGAGNFALHGFNRGLVSARALARVDLERMRLSAEQQTNWSPRSLGSMSLRPGLGYISATKGNNAARLLPFVYSATSTAILECTDSFVRPLPSGSPITRVAVSSEVTNGDFSSGTGWTITGTGGASGSITGGKLVCIADPMKSYVVTSRTMSVAGGDQAKEHAFRIVVERGPVMFRAGSTSGGQELIAETVLNSGTHSLAFTPGSGVGTVYIQFESRVLRETIVDSITIEGAGEMTLPSPWLAADLDFIRVAQSGDVLFVACAGYQPRRLERRGATSWSITNYEPQGPFTAVPGDENITLSVGSGAGATTLTASRPFFTASHIGAQFRIFTPGYNHYWKLGQALVYSPAIRVNGVGTGRNISIVTTGTWAGTLTVQKSYVGEDSGFVDTATTITSNTTTTITDSADNTALWVRVGFNTGGYTSGLVEVQLTFGAGGTAATAAAFNGSSASAATTTSTGGRFGMCRVLSLTSTTVANVEVLSIFSSNIPTYDWYEGEWSDRRGWPSAVALHEGRLFFAGRDKLWGSISDAYSTFDPSQEVDSGPISRSIGVGPIQYINWLLPLSRLVLGTEASEVTVKSSQFDEPLTPTNFALKDVSTYGSARIAALKVDTRGIFVEKSGIRVLELAYSVEVNDYIPRDLTSLCPDLNVSKAVARIAVQRQPDTRVHCVRSDGTVAVLVVDPLEDVKCWVEYETDGDVEDVCVLPGTEEDEVYYVVKRVIGGATKRYIEKFAKESECIGGTLNKQADSFIVYSGSATTTITGLSHLEGESVVVWGGGADLSPDDVNRAQTTYTVASGSITLSTAVTSAVVGLPYEARFKSTKLAYAAQGGTALLQNKRVHQLGLILHKTHHKGLYHGSDFDIMDGLPDIEDGTDVATGTIHDHYDADMIEHPGDWDTDARLCLLAKAPRPCTVLGAVINIKTHG
jgi:hypothetical protein